MNNTLFSSFPNSSSIDIFATTLLASAVTFLPRFIVAVIVFLVSKVLAKQAANLVLSLFTALNLKKIVASFKWGISLSEDLEVGMANTASVIAKYAVIYVGLIFALQIVGLSGIAQFLGSLVNVLPKFISALFILIIGIVLAGIIESLIKKALVTFDPATARLGGKTASYTVLSFFGLMSLSELGLATTFINTLFIGLVATTAIAFGLAVGLGSKDLVSKILGDWYSRRKKSNG